MAEHALTALVTGTSSGIGEAIAVELLAAGWSVVGLSRSPGALAGTAGFAWVECDLSSSDAVERALGELPSELSLDAVVHAAGLQHAGHLGTLDHAGGAQMWAVHVAAAERLVDTLASTLVDGGRVLLIGSRTMVGVPGKSQYAATKAALAALAGAWAAELAPRGITVNVVAPGPTRTAMLTDPNRAAVPVQPPPLGRLVEPAEVAGLCVFLLGPGGAMVSGQTWVIDGGASLR